MFRLLAALLASFFLTSSSLEAQRIKILSCDGGGIRGAASLHILKRLQDETGVKFHEHFDLFAGTSTGSMIALSLAAGLDVEQVLSDYQEMSLKVFSRSSYFTIYKPEYDPNILRDFIIKTLEKSGYGADATLGDLPKKIVVTTVCLDDPATKRYKLAIRENFTVEGKKAKIVDVILESTAAPTYFPSEKGCIDGGIGMNDPSLAALMTAYVPGTTNMSDFKIFSIGTGYAQDEVAGDESWGVSQWFTNFSSSNRGSVPLIEVLMDVQQQIPGQVCSRLLGPAYIKFDFPLTQPFGLDEAEKIPNLLDYTDSYIQSNTPRWTEISTWLQTHIYRRSFKRKATSM